MSEKSLLEVVVATLLLVAVLLVLRPSRADEPGLWPRGPTPAPTTAPTTAPAPLAAGTATPAPVCTPVLWRPGRGEVSLVLLPVSC